jgi:general secretion pathway protein B
MSLISEALKKAEQQRRLGVPPDLGTPFATRRPRRSLLPFIAAGIVVALGAGAWLTFSSSGPDTPAPAAAGAAVDSSKRGAQAPAAGTAANAQAGAAQRDPAAASTATERRPVMGANAVANSNVVGSLAPPPRLNNQAPPQDNPPTVKEVAERESEPHPAGANPLAPGEAAPLALGAPPPETAVNDPEGVAAKMAVKEKEMAATPPPAAPLSTTARQPGLASAPPPAASAKGAAPASTATAKGTTPAATATANGAAPANPATARGAAPANATAAPPVAAPPAATPPAAAATAANRQPPSLPNDTSPLEALPAFWELPYNVRKELPELKLSMHVYSATPAKRFVVLNGNRQVEGDELGGDVRLTEIRTDGVVLTYQSQRFLLPRGGN